MNRTTLNRIRHTVWRGVSGHKGYAVVAVVVLVMVLAVSVSLTMTQVGGLSERRAIHRMIKTRTQVEVNGVVDAVTQKIRNDDDALRRYCPQGCKPGEDSAYYAPSADPLAITDLTAYDAKDCWRFADGCVGPNGAYDVHYDAFTAGALVTVAGSGGQTYVVSYPDTLEGVTFIHTNAHDAGRNWAGGGTADVWDSTADVQMRLEFVANQPVTIWIGYEAGHQDSNFCSNPPQPCLPRWISRYYTQYFNSDGTPGEVVADRAGSLKRYHLYCRSFAEGDTVVLYNNYQYNRTSVSVPLCGQNYVPPMYIVMVTLGGVLPCKEPYNPLKVAIGGIANTCWSLGTMDVTATHYRLLPLIEGSSRLLSRQNAVAVDAGGDMQLPMDENVDVAGSVTVMRIPEKYHGAWYLTTGLRENLQQGCLAASGSWGGYCGMGLDLVIENAACTAFVVMPQAGWFTWGPGSGTHNGVSNVCSPLEPLSSWPAGAPYSWMVGDTAVAIKNDPSQWLYEFTGDTIWTQDGADDPLEPRFIFRYKQILYPGDTLHLGGNEWDFQGMYNAIFLPSRDPGVVGSNDTTWKYRSYVDFDALDLPRRKTSRFAEGRDSLSYCVECRGEGHFSVTAQAYTLRNGRKSYSSEAARKFLYSADPIAGSWERDYGNLD